MKQTVITEIEEGEIQASFVRFGTTFALVAYHLTKMFTREEGLKIKNQYNMVPTPEGYQGVIPKSVFIGGKKMEEVN